MPKMFRGSSNSSMSRTVVHLFFFNVVLIMCLAFLVDGKGMRITMVAPWNETALLQEGCEWLAANTKPEDKFYACLRSIWARTSNDTQLRGGALTLPQKLQFDILLDVMKDFHVRPTQMELLKMQLAMRMYSPAVAAHWQLAQLAVSLSGGCSTAGRPFALVDGAALCDEAHLDAALTALGKKEKQKEGETTALFPDVDHIHPQSAGHQTVVLYGILGEARTMHLLFTIERYLKNIRFAFRHLPLADVSLPDGVVFSDVSWDGALFVQGYGVTVDLKNVEYKAMDDKKKHEGESTLNEGKEVLTEDSTREEEVIGGFDMRLIRSRYEGLNKELKSFEDYMIDATGAEEVKVDFHMWESQHMGIAAAQYVMKADNADRLATLQEILTRFPLYASTLSRKGASAGEKMSYEMRNYLDMLSQVMRPGTAAVFLNGRDVKIKSRDVFSLLKGLENDEQLLIKMSTILESCGATEIVGGESSPRGTASEMNKIIPHATYAAQRKAHALGEKRPKPRLILPYRAVHWINNIETDPMYGSFPQSLSTILSSNFYGTPNMPRKNLLHVVCVVDPTEPFGIEALKLLTGLIMRRAPFRAGVVLWDKTWKSTVSGTVNADGTGISVVPTFSTVTLLLAGALWELGIDKTYIKLEFLETIDQLTQDTNTLSEESLRTAAEEALKAAGRRTLDDVLSNDLFLEDYQWTQERVRALGLTNVPVTFLNGMRFTGDIMSSIRQFYMPEITALRTFVRKGDLRDDADENFYDVIMRLHGAKERYRASIFDRQLFAEWGSQHIVNFLQHQPFIFPSTPPKSDGAGSSISAVLMLQGPMTELSRSAVALTAQYMHNCKGKHSGCSQARLTYVWCNTHVEKDRKMANDIEHLLWSGSSALVAEYMESVIGQRELSSELRDALLDGTMEPGTKRNNTLHESLREAFCSTMALGSLSPVEILVNGRRIVWEADFDARDLDDILDTVQPFAVAARDEVRKVDFRELLGREVPDPADRQDGFLSAKVSAVAAVLAADLEKHGERAEHEILFAVHEYSEGFAFIAGPASGSDPRHQLSIVIDPIARESQLLVSLCDYIARSPIGARCLVYMNPSVNVGKPMRDFYQFVADTALHFDAAGRVVPPAAMFHRLPTKHLLTVGTEEPEGWTVFPMEAKYDLDNVILSNLPPAAQYLTATYRINSILISGSASIEGLTMPPRGLPLMIRSARGSHIGTKTRDTLVMTNLGYFQLQSAPGVWYLGVQPGAVATAFRITKIDSTPVDSEDVLNYTAGQSIPIVVSSFIGNDLRIDFANTPGHEHVNIEDAVAAAEAIRSEWPPTGPRESRPVRPTINIYTVASGHLYERFLRMMMYSVMQTSSDVHGANTTRIKFWLIENFLSPQFKEVVPLLAENYGFDVGFVTYRWPWWLQKQTEKQRIIWGYKILFLDVLFPLDVDRVIFVDADQALRADLHELYNMDIGDAPTAYTPFCSKHPNEATRNFRFWEHGFWINHLAGKPYHISAIYLVNLHRLRAIAGGDTYRIVYSDLSRDPNSLANLDQDLPNYLQSQVPIFSLPEEWLWCETWCSEDSKEQAKTIDLCNNPLTKMPKLENAKIIIKGWEKVDAELEEVSERLLKRGQSY